MYFAHDKKSSQIQIRQQTSALRTRLSQQFSIYVSQIIKLELKKKGFFNLQRSVLVDTATRCLDERFSHLLPFQLTKLNQANSSSAPRIWVMHMDNTYDKGAWDFLTHHSVTASVSGQDTLPAEVEIHKSKSKTQGKWDDFNFETKSNKELGGAS